MRLFQALAAAAALLVGSAAMAQTAPASFGKYDPLAAYSEQVITDFYVPMRDGVKLAVRLYRPAEDGKPADGKFPVIWHHTIERARSMGMGDGGRAQGFGAIPSLTNYGYVVAQVERRGTGASTGARRGYHDRNEAYDAYEMTEWLATRPWSAGPVGIYGCSNTGEAALHALTVAPPHLKAAFSGCFSWHKYDGMLRGGIFAQWGTGPERTFEQDMTATPVDGDADKSQLRVAATQHQQSTVLRDLWAGLPYRDSFSPLVGSRFWGEGAAASYKDVIERSGVALYVVGGWKDEIRKEGAVAYANFAPDKRRWIIGDWAHCLNDDFNLLAEAHRFFDAELKGIDTGLKTEDPIHYFTVNAAPGAEWRSAKVWPLPNAKSQELHLAGNALTTSAGGKSAAFTVRYDIDCLDPKTGKPQPVAGPYAQPCPVAHGGPAYTGAALKADTEVTGHPIADIWITADAPDVNLFAYIEDVAPDGTVRVVSEGRLKAMVRKLNDPPYAFVGLPYHRAYAEDAQPLKPGEAAELKFDLLPVSWVFKAGHRIRVSVAGADYRERDRTPKTPAPKITILSRSTVSLPVIPAS